MYHTADSVRSFDFNACCVWGCGQLGIRQWVLFLSSDASLPLSSAHQKDQSLHSQPCHLGHKPFKEQAQKHLCLRCTWNEALMKLQVFELRQANFSFYLIFLLPSLHLRTQMHKKLEVVVVGFPGANPHFQFCKMRRVLETDGDDGSTTLWRSLRPLDSPHT